MALRDRNTEIEEIGEKVGAADGAINEGEWGRLEGLIFMSPSFSLSLSLYFSLFFRACGLRTPGHTSWRMVKHLGSPFEMKGTRPCFVFLGDVACLHIPKKRWSDFEDL